MKTNATKALIYDDDCPLCISYTRAFVKLGILAPEERVPFSKLRSDLHQQIGRRGQGNEIPLVDLNGGETLYGVDALLCLLSRRWPWIGKLFGSRALYRPTRALYALFSYNRRVIFANETCSVHGGCGPDFHTGYRLGFVVFAALFSALISWLFGNAVQQSTGLFSGMEMLLICGAGWAIVMLAEAVIRRVANGETLHTPGSGLLTHFGHLATLQIIGVLILVPSIIIAPFTGTAGIVLLAASVACSSFVMLRGHIRRMRIIGASQWHTAGWFVSLQASAVAGCVLFC
jgi:hypothetical protein